MARYTIIIENRAKKQLADIYKSGKKVDIKRIEQIFKELAITPTSGVGKPEMLKYQLSGFWSRHINHKDRLIYKIDDDSVILVVLSAKGHYNGK